MKLVLVLLPLCVCTVNGWLFDSGTFGFSNSDQHQTSNTWQTSCVVCQDVYVPEGKRILKLSPVSIYFSEISHKLHDPVLEPVVVSCLLVLCLLSFSVL